MARSSYLPCTVRHITNAITFEQTSNILPLVGCKLFRIDGVKGGIVSLHGNALEVVWNNGNRATYTDVKFGAVI